MRTVMLAATAAAAIIVSAPANAQAQQTVQPAQASPLARQALSSGDQPDVLLDVPNLEVEQLTVDVANLDLNISLDARLANLLKLTAGAEAHIDQVKIDLKGVRAQATLIVRLDNVRAIIERTLQTLDNNPQIIGLLTSSLDNTVGTLGGVANNAIGTVGGVTSSLLQNGQLLDLVRSGLTEVSRTVNGQGQTVRQVRNSSGQLLEVATDTAGRIVSSRTLQR